MIVITEAEGDSRETGMTLGWFLRKHLSLSPLKPPIQLSYKLVLKLCLHSGLIISDN